MKKIISALLAMVLLLSLSVTAFATENKYSNPKEEGTNQFVNAGTTDSANVEATYAKPADVVPTIYYVTVAWQQTGAITYTDAQDTYTWKPGSMTYEKTSATAQGWTVEENANIKVTVTNKSNAGITAECAEPAGVSGIALTGAFAESKNSVSLGTNAPANHEVTAAVEAVVGDIRYDITGVTGTLSGVNGTSYSIATITLTLKAADPVVIP